MSEICRFIHAEKANYTIVLLCRVMKTARSAFYAWVAGIEARETRRRADAALAHEITVIHLASKGTYGAPRVAAELHRRQHPVNGKRATRIMREHGIAGHTRRTGRRSLTQQDSKVAPAPDLIGRHFHAETPGQKILGDITYIPTAEGWLHLAGRLDLATREVTGYPMADHHRADLVVDALCARFAVVHVRGKGNLDPSLHGVPGYWQLEYLHEEMADALWLADLVIGRAGAGATTLVELEALGNRAVLIPLPATVSRGDQLDNAAAYTHRRPGLCVVVPDDEKLQGGASLAKACIELSADLDTDPQERPDPQAVHRAADLIARETVAAARPQRALHTR